MLTPQEMQDKKFAKAVFGGYDMSEVDALLDAVSADYEKLYKENAVLKGKLKVLAETVEEYRSVDDAMRQTLLNAQNMAAKVLEDAKKQSTEMTENARREAIARVEELREDVEREEQRLQKAKSLTAKYIGEAVEACETLIRAMSSLPKEAIKSAPRKEEPKESPEDSIIHAIEEAIPEETADIGNPEIGRISARSEEPQTNETSHPREVNVGGVNIKVMEMDAEKEDPEKERTFKELFDQDAGHTTR